jgi:predicted CoA-binding protein
MNHDNYPADYIRGILESVKTIALVGASSKKQRPSHSVMKFLLSTGYEVIPVNPGLAGQMLLGQLVYAALRDIPKRVDMIDIFRNSVAAGGVVDEALELKQKPSVIWMQLGVRSDAATARAEAQGIKVVINRCPAIELLKRQS